MLGFLAFVTVFCAAFSNFEGTVVSRNRFGVLEEGLSAESCIANSSELIYIRSRLSAEKTFEKCLHNVIDPSSIPNYDNGSFNGILLVNTSIELNNLHVVDAVAGSVTLDFYLRLYWKDDRLSMPAFWEVQPSYLQVYRMEISAFVSEGGLWKPDVRLHDAESIDVLVETIRLNSSNVVFWSRHMVATFMQPNFNFEQYPNDNQEIIIRYGSYAYREAVLKMNFWGNPISLNSNYDDSKSFEKNPIWIYEGQNTYKTYTSSSSFSNIYYKISIQRDGQGIITRLVFPIGLLLVLAGVSYWTASSGRVELAVSLLVSVSALYIVIIGNIPLLGYLTNIDSYVFWMFVLLILVIISHQVYATLKDKADTWPLRIFYMRLIEFGGRVAIFPAIVGLYFREMGDAHKIDDELLVTMIIVTIFILIREIIGLKKTWYETVDAIVIKGVASFKSDGSDKLSKAEEFILKSKFGGVEFQTNRDYVDAVSKAINRNDSRPQNDDIRDRRTALVVTNLLSELNRNLDKQKAKASKRKPTASAGSTNNDDHMQHGSHPPQPVSNATSTQQSTTMTDSQSAANALTTSTDQSSSQIETNIAVIQASYPSAINAPTTSTAQSGSQSVQNNVTSNQQATHTTSQFATNAPTASTAQQPTREDACQPQYFLGAIPLSWFI